MARYKAEEARIEGVWTNILYSTKESSSKYHAMFNMKGSDSLIFQYLSKNQKLEQ